MGKFRKSRIFAAMLLGMALTACGGGGGGGSDDPTPTPGGEVTTVAKVSELADKFDSTVNKFACYAGKDEKKCGLVIYQVNLESWVNGGDAAGWGTGWGDSLHTGTLGGVKDNLDWIKASGANAIWITPVFHTSESGDEAQKKTNASGYYATTYMNSGVPMIDDHFGDADGLKDLVKTAHEKGMYVFLDGVFGHAKNDLDSSDAGGKSPLMTTNCRGKGGSTDTAGETMTCFNWESDATLEHFKSLATTMISDFKIDGWRLDQAYQVPVAKWKILNEAIHDAAKDDGRLGGFTLAEVWDGGGNAIESDALEGGALDSAFNFPLRYKIVQVLGAQENENSPEFKLQAASNLADNWGYGSFNRYSSADVMPAAFSDNHDLVRFGNLLFRGGFVDEGKLKSGDAAAIKEYTRRHLLVAAFNALYSGPMVIYYGQEYGDWTAGFSKQLSSCGSGTAWCDDHVSRTQAKVSESELANWQVQLRNNTAELANLHKNKKVSNSARYHIYSTTDKPKDASSENFYVDVKNYNNGETSVLLAMSSSTSDRKLEFSADVVKYICQKAVGEDECYIHLMYDTSKDSVNSPDAESQNSAEGFNIELPALTAKIYSVRKLSE